MSKKWSVRSIAMLPHAIPDQEYNDRIAELAKIIYCLSQELHSSQSTKPSPFIEPVSSTPASIGHNQTRRTGTHG